MNLLIICLMLAALAPILAKAPMMRAMMKETGYDNHHPRAQYANLTGYAARAHAGHQNAFESLILFAPAVVLAVATDNTGVWVQAFAVAHLLLRGVYHWLYLANLSTARSTIWAAATLCSFAIMGLSLG